MNHKQIRAIEAAAVALLIIIPLSVQAGLLSSVSGLLSGDTLVYEKTQSDSGAGEVKLLSAATSPDPKANQGGGDIIVDEGALQSGGPFALDAVDEDEFGGEISVHVVRPCTEERCETLSHIAEMYGVSVNTILWANDISDPKSVQPGDTLVILPITGVRHVVKDSESLTSIAKKYGAKTSEEVDAMVSEILAYNRLASASEVSPGDTVVVPGGVMHQATPKATVAKGGTPTRTTGGGASGLVNPAPGAVRTQGIHGYNAVDLAAAVGTTVRAAAAGEVIIAKSGGWNGGYGNYVVIKHANGVQTLYAHLSSVSVTTGEQVSSGATVGGMGTTGRSTGSHLHFEVRGASNPF